MKTSDAHHSTASCRHLSRRRALQYLGALAFSSVLWGCSPKEARQAIGRAGQVLVDDATDSAVAHIPSTGLDEVDRLVHQQIREMARKIADRWGDERVASPREYVKYTDDYQTRAIVNFDEGVVTVETVRQEQPRMVLEEAIVATLLTPKDPSTVDLLSDEDVTIGAEPFLHGLVLDHQGQPIRYEWRATQYARYLLENAYQHTRQGQRPKHWVSFAMEKDYQNRQQLQFYDSVHKYGGEYRVKTSLIYAVMEAESSFNPYAMSHIPAYGLMQIVPSTAGRDSHRLIYGRDGTPTKEYLFTPEKNIRMGAAYLSILNDRYLAGVRHGLSREYCVIAGYNTGSGNVLRSFDRDRSAALQRINSMSPQQVFDHMVKHLPFEETRNYIQKVVAFQKKYQ
ncbi:murein transglycosylase domain-containing protein [Desulfurispira natronophila]|uniref:Membrane-bound lytic murein transglycosylase C n=1 Tax=Desulfurispira natronophila TaxID=682562 RepID=A0A7W7Y414_9BACT|nr:murein transglycosylase domain-containing protein [Desulfurispira natronophila]MBB5021623.1 membrane-bound lytic murein transglycosylase C [Desulfurispira natronophila]